MSYAIMRVAKLKTMGSISSSAAHNFRSRETPNADPSRTDENRTEGAPTVDALLVDVRRRLDTVPIVRKNAVPCLEYFFGASPSWFDEAGRVKCDRYFDSAIAWVRKKHGAGNVITATIHRDETSPHLAVYVVPIDPRGRLNASHYIDGRKMLSEMQTDFHEKVGKQFGLKRGLEGSRARHIEVKDFYAKINARTPEVDTKVPDVRDATTAERLIEAAGLHTARSALIERQNAYKTQNAKEETKRVKALEAKATAYDLSKPTNDLRDARIAEIQETHIEPVAIDLSEVLRRHNAIRDPKDETGWLTHVGQIRHINSTFFVSATKIKGSGAIALVMALQDVPHDKAVAWLVGAFGAQAVVNDHVAVLRPIVDEVSNAEPPHVKNIEPCEATWARVRKYMVEELCLSDDLVDDQKANGCVFSDKYSNLIFKIKDYGYEIHQILNNKQFYYIGSPIGYNLRVSDNKSVIFVSNWAEALLLYDYDIKGTILAPMGLNIKNIEHCVEDYRTNGFSIYDGFQRDSAYQACAEALGQPTKKYRPTSVSHKVDHQNARRANNAKTAANAQAIEDAKPFNQIKRVIRERWSR